jgi:uncharacterized protein (TIGR03085 family)
MREALYERSEFCATLRATDPDAPTLCGDWTAALLTAHLVQRERSFTEALGRLPVTRLRHRAGARLADLVAERTYPELVDAFETGPPAYSPFALPVLREAVNLTEYAVHHEDVRRAVGVVGGIEGIAGIDPRPIPVSRQRAIWRGVRISAPLLMRSVPVGVRLVAPGWGSTATRRAQRGGAAVTVTGDPLELALLAMGRQRVARVEYDGTPEDVAAVTGARLAI